MNSITPNQIEMPSVRACIRLDSLVILLGRAPDWSRIDRFRPSRLIYNNAVKNYDCSSFQFLLSWLPLTRRSFPPLLYYLSPPYCPFPLFCLFRSFPLSRTPPSLLLPRYRLPWDAVPFPNAYTVNTLNGRLRNGPKIPREEHPVGASCPFSTFVVLSFPGVRPSSQFVFQELFKS